LTPACQKTQSRWSGLPQPRGTVIEVVTPDCSSQMQPPYWPIALDDALERRMCDLIAWNCLRSGAPTKGTYPLQQVLLQLHCSGLNPTKSRVSTTVLVWPESLNATFPKVPLPQGFLPPTHTRGRTGPSGEAQGHPGRRSDEPRPRHMGWEPCQHRGLRNRSDGFRHYSSSQQNGE
jgi:hypothetical protein